jgi:glycerophosphoryl diester phosphodiesterase
VSDFLCIAHRGASGHEPENTLRAIRRAMELGAAGVEIDVRFVDGELLIFHDARLERTTNGKGYIARKKLADLRALDAGRGEQIPTLREVFETMDRRGVINIELKGRQTALPVQALIREFVLSHGWSYEHFVVSSFHHRELRAITDPLIRIGLLLTRPSRLYSLSARRVRAWSVHPAMRYATARFVKDAHQRGLRVFVYTVNKSMDMERMRRLGVEGIFTDYPDLARALPE